MTKHRDCVRRVLPVATITLVTISVMLLAAWPGLNKPLIMDEIDFAAASRAIRGTGLPIYYRGETNTHQAGLWHPPLYVIILAAWQLIFGSSVLSCRAFGLFTACLTLLSVGIFVARRADGPDTTDHERLTSSLPLLLGLGIAATSPFFIQGSMLLDIDTQILPLMIMVFFLTLFELRRRRVDERAYWIAYGLGLAVLFLSKLTTPLLLVPTFVMYELFRSGDGRWRLQLLIKNEHDLIVRCCDFRIGKWSWRPLLPVVLGVLGFVCFLAAWFAVAHIAGWDFVYPFRWLTLSSQNPMSYAGSFSEFLAVLSAEVPGRLAVITQWMGVGQALLVIVFLIREVLRPVHGILQRDERLALLVFVTLLGCTCIVLRPAPYDFPKYLLPLSPPLTLLVVDLLIALHRKRQILAATAWITLGVVVYLMYVRARYPSEDFIYNVYRMWPKAPLFWGWILLPLCVLLIANLLVLSIMRRRLTVPLTASLLAITLGWQIAVAAKQATVPYSTAYYYGEDSLTAVTEYLRGTLPGNVVLIAPKDVGFLLEDRFRYVELDYDPRPAMEYPGVEYLVMRSGDGFGYVIRGTPEIWDALNEQFEPLREVGDFIIFRRGPEQS